MNEQKRKPVGILLTVILIAALLTICLELGLSYLRPDTPGSIAKHLIHFAIMFALLGGAVLLCLFCPPFKKLWAWIDQHILDKETRPIAIDIIYAVIAGLMLLHHFYVLLYYPVIPTGATKLAPIWIVIAAITVLLDKSWRNISFRLATILLIYSFERLYIKNLSITSNNSVYFSSAIYALFICLGSFSALRSSIKIPFLKTLCILWAIAIFIMSIIGLYAAWTGIRPQNLVGIDSRIIRGRLYMLGAATITSSNLGCGVIMALIGFVISKHRITKAFFFIACLMTIATNSLTDSRSSFFTLSFMISGMISLGLWSIYRSREFNKPSSGKTTLIVSLILLCFVSSFLLLTNGQRIIGKKIIEIRDGKGIISTARADETISESTQVLSEVTVPILPQFEQRNVWFSEQQTIEDTLNGRVALWRLAIEHIRNHPTTLLCGVSVDGSAASIVGREDHSHNLLMQTLLEGGIPALFLYLSFIIYFTYHAFRLWNRKGIPFWQRLLPLPVFSILLWEMAECLTHFSYGHPPMTLFWFFLGATITVSKSLGKTPKTTEQPAIPAESAVTETGE